MKITLALIFMFFCCKSSGQLLLGDSSLMAALSPTGLKNPKKDLDNFYGRTGDGKVFTIDSLRGKVSLINFWFEQCPPCIAEFEALNQIYDDYKGNRKFQMLAFTFEDSVTITRVAEKYNVQYPIISFDKNGLYKMMFDLGFPTNLLVDRTGEIILIKSGGPTNIEEAKASIDTLFATEIEKLLKQ